MRKWIYKQPMQKLNLFAWIVLIVIVVSNVIGCKKEEASTNSTTTTTTSGTTSCGTLISNLVNKWWKRIEPAPTPSTPCTYFNSNGKCYFDFSPYNNVDANYGNKGIEDTQYTWTASVNGDTLYVTTATSAVEKWKVKEICSDKFIYWIGSGIINLQTWKY